MARGESPGAGGLVGLLAAFLIIGVPIVAVLWDAINELVAGQLGRLAVVLPLLVVLAIFLVVFARRLGRLESRR